MNHWRILQGDVRDRLASLPAGCARTCVTSPPYWGLRDYGIGSSGIGLEETVDEHIAALVDVFAQVRRVLADDGTIWVNYGDAYAGSWGAQGRGDKRSEMEIGGRIDGTNRKSMSEQQIIAHPKRRQTGSTSRTNGCKPKDLIGLPWTLAFALRADGWYLRSDIIWSKPNPMPESVTDRPTKAHEYIFLLSKSKSYFYDAAAIREPYAASTLTQFDQPYEGQATKDYASVGVQNPSDIKRRITDKQRGHGRRHAGFNDRWDGMERTEQLAGGANKRSVWNVATQPYPGAHFATFPESLIEPCIKAGSAQGDTILDPFTGSGTTGAVAIRHQRNFVGVELNPAYVELARTRINAVAPMFAQEVTDGNQVATEVSVSTVGALAP